MKKRAGHTIFVNLGLFFLICSIMLITLCCQKADEPAEESVQTLTEQPSQAAESDFLTLYPGVYTEKEKAPVKKWLDEIRAINDRGTIDVDAMIKGALPEYTPGYVRSFKISDAMIRYFNQLRDPENPLLNDSSYAKKAGYKDIIAYPTLATHDDSFMTAYPNDARDKLLVADLIHSVTNIKPVYPGDTLYWVIDFRSVKDLTPETGSEYRSNAIINRGSIYNQRGEKALAVEYTVEENIKVYKEGKGVENPSFNDVWEEMSRGTEGGSGGRGGEEGMPGGDRGGEGGMPGGPPGGEGVGAPGGGRGSASTYYYTDDDWKILKELWANERHQGSTPLYWEDVKIGDQPACTLEGPVESNPSVAVPWGMGLGGNQTLKKYIMDPAIFNTLVRSETDGIYRPANKEDYVLPVPGEARTELAFGGVGQMDAVLSNAPGASGDATEGGAPGGEGGDMGGGGMMNFSRRDYAIRHFIDWMGDPGWLYNIRWGGLYSRDMAARGGVVPAVNPEANHWLEQASVPSDVMAPLYPLGQGKGDSKFIIVRSYVYDKYVLDGEFFVELGWWIETVGGSNFGEGAATIKLPSRKATN